ncbi:MAG TPA: hypothetical protein VKV73_18895 [Chloroflexota bacterium]|nr:hypothetical protein [Chloroflexota bacterium]
MAFTPGGGRSPSTRPPPAPPPTRPSRETRLPPTAQATASYSVVRWGLLVGGLVIIVDLASQAVSQRTFSADDLDVIASVDQIINFVLFSILGAIVVRDSGLIYLGAVAGIFASLLDAIVVAAATSLAPLPGPVEELVVFGVGISPVVAGFLFNLALGTVFAGISGVVYAVLQRWSGGTRQK